MKDPVKCKTEKEYKYFKLSGDIAKIKPPPVQTDYLFCPVFEHLKYKKSESDYNKILQQIFLYG